MQKIEFFNVIDKYKIKYSTSNFKGLNRMGFRRTDLLLGYNEELEMFSKCLRNEMSDCLVWIVYCLVWMVY